MDINVICITLEPKLLCIFSKEIILTGKLTRFFQDRENHNGAKHQGKLEIYQCHMHITLELLCIFSKEIILYWQIGIFFSSFQLESFKIMKSIMCQNLWKVAVLFFTGDTILVFRYSRSRCNIAII